MFPIEHHPTIRYMVYNGFQVMSNIPKSWDSDTNPCGLNHVGVSENVVYP